jgi:hypothetical protein
MRGLVVMKSLRRTAFMAVFTLLFLPIALFNPVFDAHNSGFAAPVAHPDPKSPFGVAGAMRWPDWGSFDRPADALLDTGAGWDREDFLWGLIEPHENQFDWTATDRIVDALQQRNVSILGIISYSANWATPSQEDDAQPSAVSFYPPDSSKYYWFVHTLVTRYHGAVHYWEVWNEPNSDLFWKPRPDAHAYADLLKTAYRAIKDADPDAKVLTAGFAGNAVPFLEEMLAAGAGDSFDILAIHPYAVPADPSQARQESRPDVHKMVEVELAKYHAFLQRHNFNRPLWVTEVGWPAGNWQLDEQAQADYLAQAYAQMLASGMADRVFWYSFKDEAPGGSDSWGLTAWGTGNMDLSTRRLSFAAYATSAQLLTGTTPRGRVHLGTASILADFESPATWARSVSSSGDFTTSTDQHYRGKASGQLKYRFDGPNQAVDFSPPQPIALPGKPYEFGIWMRGDASGNYLNAWLRDRDGELFKLRLGAATGAQDGWRYYGSRINTYYFPWEHTGGSPANGRPDYPLSFVAFRLENTPDEPAGGGTIYIDDIQSIEGPDVSIVRFGRDDGQVVDVLWASSSTQVSLPTLSTGVQVIDRNGVGHPFAPNGGTLSLQVNSDPTYVVHRPTEAASMLTYVETQYSSKLNLATSPACLARARVAALSDADNYYFQETGHNLRGLFRSYWESHGGLRLFGLPISEEFTDVSTDGKLYKQQYFERARFEYHPENAPPNDVQLGLLGVWVTTGRNFPAGTKPQGNTIGFYFLQTGHNMNLFQDWWQKKGGLGVFGYPLSEELQEKNAADGKTYTVQYFERNRLEYHPEYKGTENEVLLGLLGAEYLAKQGCK